MLPWDQQMERMKADKRNLADLTCQKNRPAPEENTKKNDALLRSLRCMACFAIKPTLLRLL